MSIWRSSNARSSSVTQRDLSDAAAPRSPATVTGTISTSPASLSATQRAWASARLLPRVPTLIIGSGARVPPALTELAHLGDVVAARRRATFIRRVEPEQLPDELHARMDAVPAQLLHAQRRLVE